MDTKSSHSWIDSTKKTKLLEDVIYQGSLFLSLFTCDDAKASIFVFSNGICKGFLDRHCLYDP